MCTERTLSPVLQSSSRFSLPSVVSLLNMSNDVVISVSLHLSMSDGEQEGGRSARARACVQGWPRQREKMGVAK